MFTRIDHVVIAVPDLQQGMAQFNRLGFGMQEGGTHPGVGTHNAVALFDEDYIELLAIRDAGEQRAASADAGLADFIAAGGGLRTIVLQSDDLATDVAAMRSRGVDVSDVVAGSRRTPAGQTLQWKFAVPGEKNPLPLMFIEHLTPAAERRAQASAGKHPNGVYTLERTYIVVPDAAAAAADYARVLSLPQPALQKGTVIMSDMAVFQLGPTGLGIVQPYAPGPAAAALESRGAGPFQALYRTTGMNAAARWMEEHGLPPLARGVRNTGEQAMLVLPADACGAYIGFVGPE